MKILITGADGFVGRNLTATLSQRAGIHLLRCDVDTSEDELGVYTKDCDFVFHLAGVNRPEHEEEFWAGNFGFADILTGLLEKHGRRVPVLMSSSAQAAADNPYGRSKKAGEGCVFEYGRRTGADVFVYRLPGLFGKWSRPNYNSVVATFCHNAARGLPLQVNDAHAKLKLCYIDDVIDEFLAAMDGRPNRTDRFCSVNTEYEISLGALAKLILSFADVPKTLVLPDLSNELTCKLYSTYQSYLPSDGFAHSMEVHEDEQSAFAELIRIFGGGQISVNVIRPGVTKGQHWHRSKTEKFFVVSGRGVIRFRRVDGGEVFSYNVSAERLEAVDIPPGYTHSITNNGEQDLVTLMWANEWFDENVPDTYPMEV